MFLYNNFSSLLRKSPFTSANEKETRLWRCVLHLSISTFSISLLVYPVSLPFQYVVAMYTKASNTSKLRWSKDFVKPQIGPTFHLLHVTSFDSQFDPRKYRLYWTNPPPIKSGSLFELESTLRFYREKHFSFPPHIECIP